MVQKVMKEQLMRVEEGLRKMLELMVGIHDIHMTYISDPWLQILHCTPLLPLLLHYPPVSFLTNKYIVKNVYSF